MNVKIVDYNIFNFKFYLFNRFPGEKLFKRFPDKKLKKD